MRADWMASGACISGSTAPPWGATRRAASGGAATTSTASDELHDFRASFSANLLRRLGAALRRQRSGVVPRHVGRNDGSDDDAILRTNAVALPSGRRQDRRGAAGPVDRAGERGVLLGVDRFRIGGPLAWRRAGGRRDAAAGAGARRSDRGRYPHSDRRRAAGYGMESAS